MRMIQQKLCNMNNICGINLPYDAVLIVTLFVTSLSYPLGTLYATVQNTYIVFFVTFLTE